ncbi:hypothetical protein ES703_18188 [subsurface metagenome]
MYGVCPHCRTDHPIKISAEREIGREYVEAKCIICGASFMMRKQKVMCPHCDQEIFLAPEVIKMGKAELIYENQPDSVKAEI